MTTAYPSYPFLSDILAAGQESDTNDHMSAFHEAASNGVMVMDYILLFDNIDKLQCTFTLESKQFFLSIWI